MKLLCCCAAAVSKLRWISPSTYSNALTLSLRRWHKHGLVAMMIWIDKYVFIKIKIIPVKKTDTKVWNGMREHNVVYVYKTQQEKYTGKIINWPPNKIDYLVSIFMCRACRRLEAATSSAMMIRRSGDLRRRKIGLGLPDAHGVRLRFSIHPSIAIDRYHCSPHIPYLGSWATTQYPLQLLAHLFPSSRLNKTFEAAATHLYGSSCVGEFLRSSGSWVVSRRIWIRTEKLHWLKDRPKIATKSRHVPSTVALLARVDRWRSTPISQDSSVAAAEATERSEATVSDCNETDATHARNLSTV